MPIGILGSLVICTVLYVLFAYVLSGVATVEDFRSTGREASVAFAITKYMHGYEWLSRSVTVAILAGFSSVILVMLLGQSRVFYSMSNDGLVPRVFSDIHPRFRTPYKSNMLFFVFTGLFAAFLPEDIVGEMTSIGTLFAFVVVSLAVIVLRIKRPEARRPFRVPGGHVIPTLGVLACIYLMVSLSVMTWVRFLGWLDIGMIIYWFYGRTHSPLAIPAEAAARSATENLANFLKMLGYMLLFNGFCITLLAYLTILNVTNETLAKWGELDGVLSHIGMHVNPEIADAFGWKILAAGAAVAVVGHLVGRSSAKR
jgi:amino acid transporter